jgi:hypothetical protein
MPLKITIEGNELLTYCKLEPNYDDGTIYIMLEAAKIEAETFLNTDFSTIITNEDGTTTIEANEAPATVKEWVFARVAQRYESIGSFVRPDYTLLQPHRVHSFRGF